LKDPGRGRFRVAVSEDHHALDGQHAPCRGSSALLNGVNSSETPAQVLHHQPESFRRMPLTCLARSSSRTNSFSRPSRATLTYLLLEQAAGR
jgi:hypothetical protein